MQTIFDIKRRGRQQNCGLTIYYHYYYNRFTALWILSGTTRVSRYISEETFTHSHLAWSSIIPYLLPPSITIHGIVSVQFTCLTVFLHNLRTGYLGLAPSSLNDGNGSVPPVGDGITAAMASTKVAAAELACCNGHSKSVLKR